MPIMPCICECSTSRHFVKMVRAAADSTCEKKVLMPYRPNAPRNRPKETVSASANACRTPGSTRNELHVPIIAAPVLHTTGFNTHACHGVWMDHGDTNR